ncbi:MAG: iron donor protein CyaY [Planctomycetota bacterium]
MTDPRFLHLADACLQGLLTDLDRFDPDELEADLGGGVLRIAFADGRSCVVNRQSAANQIWMAEGASAWHFAYDEPSGQWQDTKGRGPLRRIVAEILSARLGRRIAL